jgi:hypothetical protein
LDTKDLNNLSLSSSKKKGGKKRRKGRKTERSKVNIAKHCGRCRGVKNLLLMLLYEEHV